MDVRGRLSWFWTVAFVPCFFAGCVAVDVGRPQEFRHRTERVETDAEPSRVLLEKARVRLSQRGETAVVSVDADTAEEHRRRRYGKDITVRRQKRLAFGFFPGAAELVWMPDGALESGMTAIRTTYEQTPRHCGFYQDQDPGLGLYAKKQLVLLAFGFGLPQVIYTVDSMLFAPFETWACSNHDFIDRGHWRRGAKRAGQRVADASEFPRLRALAEFPEAAKRRIGVRTCFDVGSTEKWGTRADARFSTPMAGLGGDYDGSHCGVFGFHKYLAVFVDVDESGEAEAGEPEVRKMKRAVEGPYEVELSIPGVGHSERRVVGRGKTDVAFALPKAAHEMSIEAHVSVRECPNGGGKGVPDLTRQAIRDLAGARSVFDVNLRARGCGPDAVGGYEIEQIQPTDDGQYTVRVHVAEAAQARAAADGIFPEVRRLIRETHVRRHPAARAGEVRDWVEWKEDESAPGILVFTGWAFSAKPLASGWTWDEESRRGTIRVLVSDGAPEEEVRQWVRDNIALLVSDKNILAAADGLLPGAAFRCVSECFENGVFSVEFELDE